MNGYRLTVTEDKGVVFDCPYRQDEWGSLISAIKTVVTGQRTATVIRCEEPPPPQTMEQWIAAGHTSD